MKKTQLIEELHRMKFEDVYNQHRRRKLSCEEASEILGISPRTFYRKCQRYDSSEFNGCVDLRIGM